MLSADQQVQVQQLVLSTGDYIRKERLNFHSENTETKKLHDLVSYVDKTSEEKLREGLTRIIPGSIFWGEETGQDQHISDYRWIVDPLDGTTNFIHNIPHFCISIALQHNSTTVAGWVYEINKNELYRAVKNEGAFLHNEKIRVSNTSGMEQSLIATGFPVNKFARLDGYMKLLRYMIENTRGVRRLGTAAYDLCMVASGRVQAYYEYGLSPWDVAAGALIVQEAGGKVTDFGGEEGFMEKEEILATNTYIHSEVLKQVQLCM